MFCDAAPRPKTPNRVANIAMRNSSKVNPSFSINQAPNQNSRALFRNCTEKLAPKAIPCRKAVAWSLSRAFREMRLYRSTRSISSPRLTTVVTAAIVSPMIAPASDDSVAPLLPVPRTMDICRAVAAAMMGSVPSVTRARGHMKMSEMTTPAPMLNMTMTSCWIGSPVFALMRVASFERRVVTAPTEFSGKSKYPTSWRTSAVNISSRSRRLSFSELTPKP
mmetsp:Transcript_13829/g.51614  ORF Transcript_13829/g.51614 Transcript_13829/m.51614 type:complete len:221 (+) Transcript_13829:418-1080(+)